MIGELLGILGWSVLMALFGYTIAMDVLEEEYPEAEKHLKTTVREKWDAMLDAFKTKSKESKIEELKKEIEELENE